MCRPRAIAQPMSGDTDLRLQPREIINGRWLVTTENQERGQRRLQEEAAGPVFSWCVQHYSGFQTVNMKEQRALTERPETLNTPGTHWLLLHHIIIIF